MRSPSGFVVSALRDGWDLSEAVAEEREARQRERRETQQADAEAAARSAQERQRVQTDGWSAAISATLDDRALACAIAAVTRPVPGVGRRSAPVVHAELITWAAAVACRDSGLADAPLPGGFVVTGINQVSDEEVVLDGTLAADTGLAALEALVDDLTAAGSTIDLQNLPGLAPGSAVLAALETRAYRAEVMAEPSGGVVPVRISVNT